MNKLYRNDFSQYIIYGWLSDDMQHHRADRENLQGELPDIIVTYLYNALPVNLNNHPSV